MKSETFGIPIIVAIISGLTAYMIARRKGSGSIRTSEAGDLWAEAQAIRKDLRTDNQEMRELISTLRDRLNKLEQQHVLDESTIKELKDIVESLENKLKDMESKYAE